MKDDNPFRVLGIPARLAMELTADQLMVVAKDIYRSLQKIYHPDKPGGNATKSRELNDAMARLNDKTLFLTSLQQFLANPDPLVHMREKHLKDAQSMLTAAEKKVADLEERNSWHSRELESMRVELASARLRLAEHIDRMFVNKRAGHVRAIEIEYTPLIGTSFSETRSFIYTDCDWNIVHSADIKGIVLGSVEYEHLLDLGCGTTNWRLPFDSMKDRLAPLLRPVVEKGRVLLCLMRRNLEALGLITAVRKLSSVHARKLQGRVNNHDKNLRMYADMLMRPGKPTPIGAPYSFYPGAFNGAVLYKRGEHINGLPMLHALIIRHGKVTRYGENGEWREAGSVIGSIPHSVAREFFDMRGREGSKVMIRELRSYLRYGGLDPVIAEGRMLVGLKSDTAMMLAVAQSIKSIGSNYLVDDFTGLLEFKADSCPRFVFASKGMLYAFQEGEFRHMGSALGTVNEPANLESARVRGPWIEKGASLIYRSLDESKIRQAELREVNSFNELSNTKRTALLRKVTNDKKAPLRLPVPL